MRVFRWEIMSYGKTLDERCVWSKIAVLRVGDLKFIRLRSERRKHHPGNKDEISRYEEPVGDCRSPRALKIQTRFVYTGFLGRAFNNSAFPFRPGQKRDRRYE